MTVDPRDQFGREAEKYLTSKVHADSDQLASLVELVKPKGGTVIDVGTGAGHLAFAWAPFVDRVIALDPTPKMLEVTAREAERRGLANLAVCEATAELLPFEASSSDGVSCRLAAHHFDSVPAFLKEVERILKPGGWFLLVDTVAPDDPEANRDLNEFEAIRDPSHRRNLRIGEWVELAEMAGLQVEAVSDRFKRLELQEWMDRMSVSREDQVRLGKIVADCKGALRVYLDPDDHSFNLQEMTLLAKKR